MDKLIEWFNQENKAKSLHPIELAALFYYKFVKIQPFNDGNGRTARLFTNLILTNQGYPLLTIKLSYRPEHYKYLEIAKEH